MKRFRRMSLNERRYKTQDDYKQPQIRALGPCLERNGSNDSKLLMFLPRWKQFSEITSVKFNEHTTTQMIIPPIHNFISNVEK